MAEKTLIKLCSPRKVAFDLYIALTKDASEGNSLRLPKE
jgi:hypothetical protein